MGVLHTILALIVTLGILVTVHEYGHFWVARRCGVKVLKFSVGFGKPLYRWFDKTGTEYAIAWIPLGGYVSMLDEREGDVSDEEKPFAFNQQSVWKRIAIVAAGPVANFLLAILTYWVLFVSGTSALAPVVGTVQPDSLAFEAGIEPQTELISIDGEAVHSWQDAGMQLLSRVGDTGQIRIVTQEWQGYSQTEHSLSIQRWLAGEKEPNPLTAIGVTPFSPHLEAIIGQVLPDGAAAESGLKAGDQLLRVNGKPVDDWMHWVRLVQESPDQELMLEIKRGDRSKTLSITPRLKRLDDGREIGYIGAAPKPAQWPEGMVRDVQYGVFEAVSHAVAKTGDMIGLTLDSIRKMVIGLISVDNLSGPITIAQVASDSAKGGFESFLTFLAYISISLGVLNLLPIPVLDGGHLLFYLIEAVTGRPVPEKAQQFGLRLGMMLLAGLMMIAFYNDLMRL